MSDKINKLLAEKGWSKREAARRCEIPYVSFVNITLGARKNVWPDTMKKLAQGFGVSIDSLAEEDHIAELDVEQLKRTLKQMSEDDLGKIVKHIGFSQEEVEIVMLLKQKKLDGDAIAILRAMLNKLSG